MTIRFQVRRSLRQRHINGGSCLLFYHKGCWATNTSRASSAFGPPGIHIDCLFCADRLRSCEREAAALDRCRRTCRDGLRRPAPVSAHRGSYPEDRSEDRPCARHDPGGGDSGLRWAEGTLWVGQYRDRKIYQVRCPNRGDSSHDRVQPLRHRSHLDRRRAVVRRLGVQQRIDCGCRLTTPRGSSSFTAGSKSDGRPP